MKRITESAIGRIATLIIVVAAVLDATLLLSGTTAWTHLLAIYVAVPMHALLVLCMGTWWLIRRRKT